MNVSSISYRRDLPEKIYSPTKQRYNATSNPSLINIGPKTTRNVDRKSLRLNDEYKFKLVGA